MKRWWIVVVALAVWTGGCSDNKSDQAKAPPAAAPAGGAAKAGAPGGPPPPPAVGVIKVKAEPANLTTELPGRLESTRVAQIRARVAGIVQKRIFQEGSDVKAGQPLFQLDPSPFRAAVDSAEAAVKRTQAILVQNTAQTKRLKPLVEMNAVSQQEYSSAVAAQKQAEADVGVAQAQLRTAKINLGYTTVSAPIDGRIGRALVTEGALVGQGEATQMAVIQQINPLYVNFTQSVADVSRLRNSIAAGKMKASEGEQAALVNLVMEDGTQYDKPGKLLFSDLSVDQTSGQVTLRAEVPNPDGVLLPGMYVRVRVQQARYDAVILVPQQAVQRGGQGDTVMVVDDQGNVKPRPVTLGSASGNRWIITDGLKPDEMVIVDGFQKMRPGAPVKPVPAQLAGTDKAAEKPAEKPTDKPPEKPADAAADKPIDKAAEKSTDKAPDKHTDKAPEKNGDKAADKAGAGASDKPSPADK